MTSRIKHPKRLVRIAKRIARRYRGAGRPELCFDGSFPEVQVWCIEHAGHLRETFTVLSQLEVEYDGPVESLADAQDLVDEVLERSRRKGR